MKFFSRSSRATGPKMRVPRGLRCVVDDHGRVLVERDQRAVVAAERLARAHDDRLHDLALLDGALRRRRLDRRGDDVADARIAAPRAAGDADAEELARAGVVGDLEPCFLLDHLLRLLHDLREPPVLGLRERARLDDADDVADRRPSSARRARGTCACARTTFLYFGWRLVMSTLTTIVLSPLSETTTPRRSWRRPSSRVRLRDARDRLARRRRLARGLRVLVAHGARQALALLLRLRSRGAAPAAAAGSSAAGASAAAAASRLDCGLAPRQAPLRPAGLLGDRALQPAPRLRLVRPLERLRDVSRVSAPRCLTRAPRPSLRRSSCSSFQPLTVSFSRTARSGCVRSRGG